MSNILICAENRLTFQQPISGTLGYLNTPAPSQDPDFPQYNVLHPSRYKFWKSAYPHPATHDVDVNVGLSTTYRVAGIARNRAHRGGVGITGVEVFTGTGDAYPPTFTSRGTFSVTPADNNKALDFGSSISCKQMRFRITASGPYSCKLWAVRVTSFLDLGHEAAAVVEEFRRVRSPERTTYLGNRMYGELGVGAGAIQKRFRFSLENFTSAMPGILRAAQAATALIRYRDGVWYEVVYVEPQFEHRQSITPAASAYSADVYFESLP